MDLIYECAAKFILLEQYEYRFIVSKNRKTWKIILKFKGSQDVVYIFLKQREENPDTYCVTSFFKKDTVTYSGDSLYWMLKEKISSNDCITLYQHPNYNNTSS